MQAEREGWEREGERVRFQLPVPLHAPARAPPRVQPHRFPYFSVAPLRVNAGMFDLSCRVCAQGAAGSLLPTSEASLLLPRETAALEAPVSFPNNHSRARCSSELRREPERLSVEHARRGVCHRRAPMPLGGLLGSPGQRLRWVPLAHQPLAGPAQAGFLLRFLPEPADPPLELSAFLFIIPPGIKYEPRSRLPSGTVRPHHLSDGEPARPWEKNMYFRPAGRSFARPITQRKQ